ncbi:MAG: ABC transporter ATP-binding protein [Candidatus Promineifilaceae bacterium]
MSSKEVVISFQNVSKQFMLSRNASQSLLGSFVNLGRGGRNSAETFHAVRNVSFDVHAGESVGLIGHNGSGKSTLLKLATRILRPTSGNTIINGRVSALLELGAGFHEDLTGRENVYLNGSVLGLSRNQIDAKFDEIVNFSELADFIDVSVKHYSSGMYMRLGFSVAVFCEPDVLLIDEILAVGDAAFQKKCIDRIFTLKQQGVTIVMVSHHLSTLQKLCDKLVWLDRGDMRGIGPTSEIAPQYTAYMNARIADQGAVSAAISRSGTFEAEILQVKFLNEAGEQPEAFRTGELLIIEMQYVAHRPIKNPEIGFAIYHGDTQLTGSNNQVTGFEIAQIDGAGFFRYIIPNLPFLPGKYFVSAGIHDDESPLAHDYHHLAYSFSVEAGSGQGTQGLLDLAASWEFEAVPK